MDEQSQRHWYEINFVENVDSPALIIYADRVRQNISTAIEMVGDVHRLRPHVKTHKSPDVTRLMLSAGITKFKCATVAEAEMLGMANAPDVLLAYQPVGPKAERFFALSKQYPATQYSCLIDNHFAAKALNDSATKNRVVVPVFIDLDVGMNRTGIAPEKAVPLFDEVLGLKALKFLGLHVYDGHIGDTDLQARTERSNDAFKPITALKESLSARGFTDIKIVAGGSPTFPIHAKRQEVECSPGTFVYWDAGYQQVLPEQPFQPAALVISRVVSMPGDGLICTDLGHKSVAAENPLTRRVKFLNASEFEFVGQSEEHLVLKTRGAHAFAVGDILYGLPIHICPTCALYERAVVVENGNVIGEWEIIARDRKLTI